MANFTTAGSDTYPAGHVLQVQYGERTTEWNTGASGTTYFKPYTTSNVTITPIVGGGTTSNHYICNLSLNSWWYKSAGGDEHRFIRMSHLVSGGSEVYFGGSSSDFPYIAGMYPNASGEWDIEAINIVKKITVPSALSTVFSWEMKATVNNDMYCPNGNGVCSLMITEVKA